MLFKHVWKILIRPHSTWNEIGAEEWSFAELCKYVLIPLSLLPPLAGFVGLTEFGWQVSHGDPVKLTVASAASIGLLYFIAIVVCVLLAGLLIKWMSNIYIEETRLVACLSVAVYTTVPLLLVSVLQIYPMFWLNLLCGLVALGYSVYLLYTGIPSVMQIPKEHAFVFASATLAVALVVLVGLLTVSVGLWNFGFHPVFTF